MRAILANAHRLAIAGWAAFVVAAILILDWAALKPAGVARPPTPPPKPVPSSTIPPSARGAYAITDLGTLRAGDQVQAFGINDHGEVVGESGGKPFLWKNGAMTELAGIANTSNWSLDSGLPSEEDAAAQAIDNFGDIVGWIAVWPNAAVPGDIPSGFDRPHAFLWKNGRMIDLDTGAGGSEAYAIDCLGDIAGDDNLHGSSRHAALWSHRLRAKDLGTICGGIWSACDSKALGINSHGWVVGTSAGHAFLWIGARMRDLGLGQANAINSHGVVAGASCGRACVWRNARRRYLSSLPMASPSQALAIDDPGEIVGCAGADAVLWIKGRAIDLNRLVPSISRSPPASTTAARSSVPAPIMACPARSCSLRKRSAIGTGGRLPANHRPSPACPFAGSMPRAIRFIHRPAQSVLFRHTSLPA